MLIQLWPTVVGASAGECIVLLGSASDTLFDHFHAGLGQAELLDMLTRAEQQDTYPNVWP